MIIKSVDPTSCAKVAGVIYGGLGLLFGAMVSLFSLFATALARTQPEAARSALSPMLTGVFGMGALVAFPIFYGAMGFVFAWIGAWLYNLVASKVGGIQIEVA